MDNIRNSKVYTSLIAIIGQVLVILVSGENKVAFFLFTFLIILTIFGTIFIKDLSIFKFTKKNRKKELLSKLLNHPIFNYFPFWEQQIKTNLKLKEKIKEKVFKHILINKYKVWEITLKEMVYDLVNKLYNNNFVEDKTYLDDFLKYFSLGDERYREFFKDFNYDLNDRKALGIAMEKFELFHCKNKNNFLDAVSEVCNSNIYLGFEVEVMQVLNLYQNALSYTIINGEKAINELNGHLEKLTFNTNITYSEYVKNLEKKTHKED